VTLLSLFGRKGYGPVKVLTQPREPFTEFTEKVDFTEKKSVYSVFLSVISAYFFLRVERLPVNLLQLFNGKNDDFYDAGNVG
jgi:hypothetical protein